MYNNRSLTKVRVWDLPTRIFHGLLVACIMGLAITGTVGGNAMAWHFRLGYSMLTLLLFRIVW
ncbi:MAG: cytochrome b/b6 domain-containing protein, partial [Polaromonas sp.]